MLNARHFADKLAKIQLGQTAQITAIVFGDSVPNLKMQYILPALSRAYGDLGTGTNYTVNATGDVIVNNGGSVPYDFTYHLSGSVWNIGSAGESIYGRGGGSPRCNSISIYYVKEAGAGTFKVQTAIGNGAFVDEPLYTNVDANNGSLALGIIKLSKTSGYYRVKIVGLTGRVKFYAPQFFDNSLPGVQVIHLERGGLGLDQANQMDPVLFTPYIQDINADIAFFEMKEGSTLATDLPVHISRFQTAAPNMDWIYMGSTPDSTGTVAAQNAITKSLSEAAGYLYWDGYTPCVDYASMVAIGWCTDGTHPTPPCTHYLARRFARDLGLSEIIGEASQAKVIADSVATRSLKVSSGYGTLNALGSTFKAALEITGPGDLDGLLTTQRNIKFTTGANGNANSVITLDSPITVLVGILDALERASTPGPAPVNGWRLYALDDGTGHTILVARFNTGTGQIIATQP